MAQEPVIIKKPNHPNAVWSKPMFAFKKGEEDNAPRGVRYKGYGTGFTEEEKKHGLKKNRKII